MDNKSNKEEFTDLHVHLGACSSSTLLWELAHKQGIRLNDIKEYWDFIELINLPKDVDHQRYLDKFKLLHKIQSSPDATEHSVYNAVSQSYRKSNITLLEIGFNPAFRTNNEHFDMDYIIFSAIVGMKRAEMMYPVKVGLILETDRSFAPELSYKIAEKAVKFKDSGVVGFDMSGSNHSIDFKISNHKEAFFLAQNAGLGLTIHAGETKNSAHEIEDIFNNAINPDRIGHGIRCMDSQVLLGDISRRNIHLELCPTSNFVTKVSDIIEYKKLLSLLHSYNIRYSANSDGPELLKINVKSEYHTLKTLFDLPEWRLDLMKKYAIEDSFIN